MKWDWLLNLDTVIFIIVFIAVVWCVINKKHKPPISKFDINNLDLTFLSTSSKKRLWKKYKVPKKLKKKKFNKSEEKCREIFENIYKVKFKSIRPDFLKNPTTGKNLELDGYSPEVVTYLGEGLAFEYDGIQHSKHTGVFHKRKSEFKYQCAKDRWKDIRCKELGIALIRIPYFIVYEELETYIVDLLKKKGLYIDKVKINKPQGKYIPRNIFKPRDYDDNFIMGGRLYD